jgi:predicted RNA-binding Zn ribbon-like protein
MVQRKDATEYVFDLSGGNLCLDLANTISHRDEPERRAEHLTSYADMVAFARQSGVISSGQADELDAYALRHGSEARQNFRRAIELREAIYGIFTAIAQGETASQDDLTIVTECALEALRHRSLTPAEGGYRWEWRTDGKNPLARVVWPAAQAAAELLTSKELRIARWCEARDCQRLFLDHSRNRSRRWCDMTVCGNRAKARRHYQRTRG